MFLLFESDIPFGLPPQFMDINTKRKYETIIKESIETSGDNSMLNGMVVPAYFAIPVDDSEAPSFEEAPVQNNQPTSPSDANPGSMAQPNVQDQEETPAEENPEDQLANPEDPMNQNIPAEENPNPEQSPEDAAFEQEVTPLKKLYLMQKLYRLNEILIDQNQYSNELTQILKYGHNLSYNTLIRLSQSVITQIQDKINNQTGEDDLVDKNAQSVYNDSNIDSDADALAQKINQDEEDGKQKKQS